MEISNILTSIKEEKGISPIIDYWSRQLKKVNFKINRVDSETTYLHPTLIEFLNDLDCLPFILKLIGFDFFDAQETDEIIKYFRAPSVLSDKKKFLEKIEELKKELENFDKDSFDLIKSLSWQQIERLDEAISTYFIDAYTSTVVMAVSAIEYELGEVIKKNRKIKKEFEKNGRKLEKVTFGELIKFFRNLLINNKSKNLFEKRYKRYFDWIKDASPLLDLCNKYRIDSAHLKGRSISRLVADSILNLTFEFFNSKPEEYKKKDIKKNSKEKKK